MSGNLPEDQARFFKWYMETIGAALSPRGILAQLVLAPVFAFVAIYVGAAIVHLCLLLLKASRRGFDATLTAVAYTAGLSLLFAVPACGSLVAGVWALVALVIGLGAIQRCGTGKAAAAVLAPFALVCVCCCGILGASIPAILKGAAAAKGGLPTTDL